MQSNVLLGTGIKSYKEGDAQLLSLQITENCNLRCKYCYEVHKNQNRVMPRDVAYRAIDFILGQPCKYPAIVIEFAGGECTLEMDLISDITRYFTEVVNRLKHPWRSAHMFLLSTNGTTYSSKRVQQYLWENRFQCQVAITLDGTKRKHDMNRIFEDGKGSYDIVAANAKLFLKQFDNSMTKVTFSSEDIGYTCESIIHLWDMGFKKIAANVVFENVWKPGDPEIFESQLKQLADIALEGEYWNTCDTTLFWIPAPSKSQREDSPEDDRNWCGTGTMMSIDCEGNIYPCIRFMDFSLANPDRPGRTMGNVYDGFDSNKLRAYQCLQKSLQSSMECLECNMATGCAWCSGYNYDVADSDTIFQRATHICEMHKARFRANQYYWERLEQRHGIHASEVSAYRAKFCAC